MFSLSWDTRPLIGGFFTNPPTKRGDTLRVNHAEFSYPTEFGAYIVLDGHKGRVEGVESRYDWNEDKLPVFGVEVYFSFLQATVWLRADEDTWDIVDEDWVDNDSEITYVSV